MKKLPEKPKFPFKVSKTFENGKIVIKPHPTSWSADQKAKAKEYQKSLNDWKKIVIKSAFKYEDRIVRLEKLVSELRGKVSERNVSPEVLARRQTREQIAAKKAEIQALRAMVKKK